MNTLLVIGICFMTIGFPDFEIMDRKLYIREKAKRTAWSESVNSIA